MTAGFVLALAGMGGCAQIDALKDKIEGYTNPLVTQAMFLGVEEPESEFISLEGTRFEDGAVLQVFLADASNVTDMENAPVSGGAVQVSVGNGPALPLSEADLGAYQATGDDGLSYEIGSDTEVAMYVNGDTAYVGGRLPEAARISLDFVHTAGQDLALDLSDYSFDTVLGVVIDMASGELLWTNQPEEIGELYEMTHGDEPVERLVVPGAVLSEPGIYAVGVAGMMVTEQQRLENVNTALSSYMQGQLIFNPIGTLDADTCQVITPDQVDSL
jgi:hypothetical protein